MAENDALVGILADNSSSLFSPVSGATPEEVARRRKRGETLLTQGSSVAPLAHWTQAAARGLQGAVGGLETAQARNDERAGQDSLAKVLAGTDTAESKMRALVSNPWAGDIGTRLATGQLQRQLDPIGERTRKAQMEAAEASAAQARNPDLLYTRRAEAAAKHGGGVLQPGTREYNEYVLTGDFPRLSAEAQTPDGQARARARAAVEQGLDIKDAHVRQYILSGRFPREDQAPMTATDKKAILEADEAVLTNRTVIDALTQAEALNTQTNSGWGASVRATLGNNLPDVMVPDALSSPKSSEATANFENLVLGQALGQLKSIFGAAPTEGERKILVELQASVNKPPAVRAEILVRAKVLANARLQFNEQRAAQLRSGTYYKPGGSQPGAAGGGGGQPGAGQSGAGQAGAPRQRFHNPQTGQVIEWDGSAWQEVK